MACTEPTIKYRHRSCLKNKRTDDFPGVARQVRLETLMREPARHVGCSPCWCAMREVLGTGSASGAEDIGVSKACCEGTPEGTLVKAGRFRQFYDGCCL